jgi:hypothetical protein
VKRRCCSYAARTPHSACTSRDPPTRHRRAPGGEETRSSRPRSGHRSQASAASVPRLRGRKDRSGLKCSRALSCLRGAEEWQVRGRALLPPQPRSGRGDCADRLGSELHGARSRATALVWRPPAPAMHELPVGPGHAEPDEKLASVGAKPHEHAAVVVRVGSHQCQGDCQGRDVLVCDGSSCRAAWGGIGRRRCHGHELRCPRQEYSADADGECQRTVRRSIGP